MEDLILQPLDAYERKGLTVEEREALIEGISNSTQEPPLVKSEILSRSYQRERIYFHAPKLNAPLPASDLEQTLRKHMLAVRLEADQNSEKAQAARQAAVQLCKDATPEEVKTFSIWNDQKALNRIPFELRQELMAALNEKAPEIKMAEVVIIEEPNEADIKIDSFNNI